MNIFRTPLHRPSWRIVTALLAAVGILAGGLYLQSSGALTASASGHQSSVRTVDDVVATNASPGSGSQDDSSYTNTAGVYIGGRPVDITGNGYCLPSIPTCPQTPYVPNHLGQVNDCTSNMQPETCGYVFDHATSNQIVRYATAGVVGAGGAALSPLCGPAMPLCAGAAAMLAQGVSDWQSYLSAGRCLYLHLTDMADVSHWLNSGPLDNFGTSPIGARLIDCPAS